MGKIVENPDVQELITDWFIPEGDPAQGWTYPGPMLISSDPTLIMFAHDLLDACVEKDEEDFVLTRNGRVYRGHRIESISGRFYSLRKVPQFIPELDKLGIDRGIVKMLLHPRLSAGGLVLIAGETGQGKSTTCASFLKARMEKYSSFCLTLENPPEFPLHGAHGMGMCIQTEVPVGKFPEALRGAMRCYPTQGNSILLLGEARDPETAGEALRIAMNGHLVVTTIHGGDITSAMKRMMAMAVASPGMGEIEAKSVLSSAFRLVVNQRLRTGRNGEKKLETQALFSPGGSSPVANKIREGRLEGLGTEIQQQQMLLENGQVERLLSLWDV